MLQFFPEYLYKRLQNCDNRKQKPGCKCTRRVQKCECDKATGSIISDYEVRKTQHIALLHINIIQFLDHLRKSWQLSSNFSCMSNLWAMQHDVKIMTIFLFHWEYEIWDGFEYHKIQTRGQLYRIPWRDLHGGFFNMIKKHVTVTDFFGEK